MNAVEEGDLPIFIQTLDEYSVYYTPGYFVGVKNEVAAGFTNNLLKQESGNMIATNPCQELYLRAIKARSIKEREIAGNFAPMCLTLYVNNRCNLNCRYCFSNSSSVEKLTLSRKEVMEGARIVADVCSANSLPFTVVFHGGGEPLLQRRLINQMLDDIEEIAEGYNLPLIKYVATNGVMAMEKAEWVAERFDIIGISCDGPPDIQDHQRPKRNGAATSRYVELASDAIRAKQKKLLSRVTLTPSSFHKQTQIAEYICERIRPNEIHVEPVYLGGRSTTRNCITADDVISYGENFMDARRIARQYGVSWLQSGTRPFEIHGPYCNINRNVLNLIPGGAITACFKISRLPHGKTERLIIGQTIPQGHNDNFLVINYEKITTIKPRLSKIPVGCRECFNQYHCVFFCPDICLLDDDQSIQEGNFRCEIQRVISNCLIQESINVLLERQPDDCAVFSGEISRELQA